jgi:hypothetical protein
MSAGVVVNMQDATFLQQCTSTTVYHCMVWLHSSGQAEQQARLEAQLELNRHKKKVAGLEAELQQQQTAMNQVGLHCSMQCLPAAVLEPLSCALA